MAETQDGQLQGWPCSIDIYPDGRKGFDLEVFLFTDDDDNEAPDTIKKVHDDLEEGKYPNRRKLDDALKAAGFEPTQIHGAPKLLPTLEARKQNVVAILNEFVAEETAEVKPAKYATVNAQWPEGDLPELTDQEAITAVKRLLRFQKVKFRGTFRIGTGRRDTWPRHGVYTVNPSKGWHELVHMTSHYAAMRLHPKAKGHGPQHAFIEKEMIAYVVKSGWLDGRLRSKAKAPVVKSKSEKQQVKLTGILERIKRWEQKERRAQTALAKLSKQRRYYERQLVS